MKPFVEPRAHHGPPRCTDPEAAEQYAVAAAGQPQAVTNHDRQKRLQRGRRKCEESDAIEHSAECRRVCGVTEPGADRPVEGLGRHGLARLGPSPPHQDADDGQERHGIEHEHPARAGDRDDQATDRRPDSPPDVERHRSEGDRLPQFGRGDEVRLNGLERGECESGSQPETEGQGEEAGRA